MDKNKILNFIKNIKETYNSTCLGVAAGLRLSPSTPLQEKRENINRPSPRSYSVLQKLKRIVSLLLTCCPLWKEIMH
jgi:hypothetical protein